MIFPFLFHLNNGKISIENKTRRSGYMNDDKCKVSGFYLQVT